MGFIRKVDDDQLKQEDSRKTYYELTEVGEKVARDLARRRLYCEECDEALDRDEVVTTYIHEDCGSRIKVVMKDRL